MNDQQISLKSINDLRVGSSGEGLRFFIPPYQRGYRWSQLQVTQLLEDIREFIKRPNPQQEEFYCLQPLVIKVLSEGHFEVVDGQQRLTTLLLILRHFNDRLAEKYRQALYTLEYATRPGLDRFLDMPTEETANENSDFFHFYHAIQAIEDWFGKRESEVEDMKSALLNKTKVIWFQLADNDNPVDAFTRLNVGKIPLTNDELIRALFLRRAGPEEKEATNLQLRIAYEWDQLEKALQSDAFWYFLSNQPGKEQSRIGFLFDLVAHAGGLPVGTDGDDYGVFFAFNDRLKAPDSTPGDEWQKIKQTFLALEEWFEDRVLFHMVGFLVNEGMSINEIQKRSINCSKSAFEEILRAEIFKRAIGEVMPVSFDEQQIRESVANRLDSLSYISASKAIRTLLLLFNVATLLQDQRSNMRFQFDSFKSERWDIEHIRSVTDDKPDRYDYRKDWLRNCLNYLDAEDSEPELRDQIRAFLDFSRPEATNEIFDPLYENILKVFNEAAGNEADHGIANLTLLDAHTNRSYKNAVFAVKRHRLLNLDQAGIFVPLCTRNVFLKCYSPHVGSAMFWSEEDRDGYEKAVVSTLVGFFCGKREGIQ